MGDRSADWLSEGRCGGKVLTAARLAELLHLCCCGLHHREGHSSVDYTYYVAYNAECRICHWNICSHKEPLIGCILLMVCASHKLCTVQTPSSYLDSHTYVSALVLFLLLSVKRALYTKGTEFSWTPATRWILCLLLSRPHNKPLVDVCKMFMYLKTKVIRASGSHLSSCVFPQTQTHPPF